MYGGQTQQYGEPVLHTVHYKYSQILSKTLRPFHGSHSVETRTY